MSNYEARYPRLKYFFSAYFHAMWPDLLSATWQKDKSTRYQGVVHDYKQSETKRIVAETIRQLTNFLEEDITEDDLQQIVIRQFSANIRPAGIGLTYREWLTEVLALMSNKSFGEIKYLPKPDAN